MSKKMKEKTYNGLPCKVDVINCLKGKVKYNLTQLWNMDTDMLMILKKKLEEKK